MSSSHILRAAEKQTDMYLCAGWLSGQQVYRFVHVLFIQVYSFERKNRLYYSQIKDQTKLILNASCFFINLPAKYIGRTLREDVLPMYFYYYKNKNRFHIYE